VRGDVRRLTIAATVVLLDVQGLAASADRQIGEAQNNVLARALVEAETPQAVKLPGFGFDGMPPNPKYPHIRFFQAWSSVGQGIVGSYALDVYTGDAWDLTTCREIKSRKLEKIQRKIRLDIGLSDRRYKQIKSSSPPC
jgi:hypothetical protein